MSAAAKIPLKEIHMKNGINIGGFQYRVYQHGPTWELHLHPVGGFVSLRHVDSRTTHYVHLGSIEGCEGFVDYAAPVSTASASSVSAAIDAANGIRAETQGLVSNQNRVPVKSDPLRRVDGAEDLGSSVSTEQKNAKAKHFGVKEAEALLQSGDDESVDASEDSISQDLDEETIVAAPVKKKRGRPRKVRPEEGVNA